MDVNEIKRQAKLAGINGQDLLAAKRECEAIHRQHQEFVNRVRSLTFRSLTGRPDHFWLIFGSPGDRVYGEMFHGGGDYDTVRGWDEVAQSVWLATMFCANEEDAEGKLWEFIINEPFKIPSNPDLYREAYRRLVDSRELVA